MPKSPKPKVQSPKPKAQSHSLNAPLYHPDNHITANPMNRSQYLPLIPPSPTPSPAHAKAHHLPHPIHHTSQQTRNKVRETQNVNQSVSPCILQEQRKDVPHRKRERGGVDGSFSSISI